MRRMLVAVAAVGLASALLSAPVPVVGQSGTIALSLVDASSTSTTVTEIAEGAGQQTLKVKAVASASTTSNVTVNITVGASGGTATLTTDYTRGASTTTVTINSGDTEGLSSDITITPASDTTAEVDETIRFTGTATNYTVTQVDLTITDRTIILSLVDASDTARTVAAIAEDGGQQTLKVKAVTLAATSANLTVNVNVGAAGGTATLTTDYTRGASTTTVTINSGDTEGLSSNITITPVSDTSAEGDETIRFTGTATGYTVTQVDLTITDRHITLSLVEAADNSMEVTAVEEDGGQQTLQVKAVASAATTANVTVNVTVGTAGGTATLTTDFTRGASTTTVTINSGATEGFSSIITVTPVSDTITEEHETIWFTGAANGYTLVSLVDLTITDQDRWIRVDVNNPQVTEPGAAGWPGIGTNHNGGATLGGVTNEVFTASTRSTYGSNLSPSIHFKAISTDWTDVGSSDYNDPAIRSAWVTISANSVSANRYHNQWGGNFIRVQLQGDHVAEPDEYYQIAMLEPPTGFQSINGRVTIKDDDTRVDLTVDADSGEDGNQTVLAEGDNGSGVTVSGRFSGSSSVIKTDTVVTLSAEGAASPNAGEAGTGDLTYAPSSPNTFTIPAEKILSSDSTTAASTTLTGLSIADDDVVEGPETFRVGVSSDLGANGGATMTITDDDTDIALSVSTEAVAEDDGATTVTVTASFAGSSSELTSATDVTVTVGAGDSNGATPGTDFMTSGTDVTNHEFTISIPAGNTEGSKAFTLTPTTDSDTEGIEKIKVSGTATVGEAVTVTPAEISLADQSITLSLHEAADGDPDLSAVSERGGAQTVRVKAAAGAAVSSETTVTVTVGAAGGTATEGSSADYTRSAGTVDVTIANGDTEGTADVTITPRDDGVAEGPETIRFSGAASGFLVVGDDLKITETIELVLIGSAVGEGDTNAGAVTATARFAGASSSDLTEATDVELSFGAGANTQGADFTAPTPAVTLSIPAGSTTSGASALSGLLIVQDTIAEGDQSINVGGSATGFAVSRAALSITDDDMAITLEADTDDSTSPPALEDTLSEGETAAVKVRASFADGVTNGLTSDLAVSVTAGESSPRSAKEGTGGDFTAPASPTAVTIRTGQTESDWTDLAGLAVSEDTITEGEETFLVTGTVPGGTDVSTVTLRIGASDDALQVSVSPETVAEQADPHTITVTAGFAGASASELTAATTVNMAVTAGDTNGATLATSCPTATEDACTDNAAFDISIPLGQTSADGTFSLRARQDGDTETIQTLKITGTAAGDSTNSDTATLNIADSGIQVELLNPADDTALASLGEDSGASQVKVKVTMPGAVSAETVVGLNIGSESATEDTNNAWAIREDYRISGLSTPTGTPANHELGVVVATNETTGEATFTIEIQDDNADEDDEEPIQVTGAAVNSLPVLEAALAIADNDNPPNVVLALETADGQALTDVQEDDSNPTTVQVRAAYQGTALSDKTVTIPITVGKTADGEATAGTDYQTVPAFNIVINPYETDGTNTFQLVIDSEDDSDAEGPETVTVAGDATGLPVETIGEASLTITDDDAAITLAFLNASDEPLASLEEGTGATSIKIRASYPDGKSLPDAQTISLTLEGTASASDYQATGFPTQITIPANQTSVAETFTLDLGGARDDDIDEPDETLRVSGALAGFIVNSGALEITDNDAPPTGIILTVNPNTAAENRGTSRLTVRLTATLVGNRSSQPTPVRVTVGGSGSTAASPSDYRDLRPSSLTITIPAEGRTGPGSFSLIINSDDQTESTERIRITAVSDFGNTAADFRITNVSTADPGGGGGGAPPPSGGGGGGGGAPPPAGPATPPPPPAEPVCQGRFCDEDGSVHQANIEQIAAWEITLGCDANDATKFCPSAQITRRQMAAFLYRAVNRLGPIPPPEGIEISDVPADAWYRTFADWVVSTGAFAAPDGQFNPGGVVTRADMAVMMIASFPDINAVDEPEGLFNDVTDADPEVVRAVEGMYHTGVTKGCSAEPLNYCPDQPVTRAQMASFFVRAVNYTPPTDS